MKRLLAVCACVFSLMSLAAAPAHAGPGAQGTATATNAPPPPPAPPATTGFVPPRTDKEQGEFCEAMARCQPPAGGGNGQPPKKEPIRAAQYVCEGPTWTEDGVPKTSGPHNKVPGQLGTPCVCDNADFFPVAVHGTGKTVRSDAEMVVTQFTIMCVPKDTKRYESLLKKLVTRLDSLETRQAEDDGFRDFVKRDLSEHGTKLIEHTKDLADLKKWRQQVDCDLYGLNCPEGKQGVVPALREDVDALKLRGSGLGLGVGAFYLGTPGGRVGGGMVTAMARYMPDRIGVEGELRGFYSPDFLNGNTSYTGSGSTSLLGGGTAAHLAFAPFENRRIRLLAGPGLSYFSRVDKGPREEARWGYAINIVELGVELPLGDSGVNLRPLVAPTWGTAGKNSGKESGWGGFVSLGVGFVW